MSAYSLPDSAVLKPVIRPYKQVLDDILLAMASEEAQALSSATELLEGQPGDAWAVILRHISRHMIRLNLPQAGPSSSKPSSQALADAAFAKSYISYARPLLKGQVASEWGGNQRAVLSNYGANASEEAKLLALRKNLYTNQSPDIMQKLDASNPVKSATSADQLISAVENLFQPDTSTLATCLQAARQNFPSQTASEFCKNLRQLYQDNWAPLPVGEEAIQVLVLKFHPSIAKELDQHLRVVKEISPSSIDFGKLESWTKQIDEKEVALNSGPPFTNTRSKTAQHRDHPQTYTNLNNAQAPFPTGRKRGSRGRGRGRGREFDQGHDADMPPFQKLNINANCLMVTHPLDLISLHFKAHSETETNLSSDTGTQTTQASHRLGQPASLGLNSAAQQTQCPLSVPIALQSAHCVNPTTFTCSHTLVSPDSPPVPKSQARNVHMHACRKPFHLRLKPHKRQGFKPLRLPYTKWKCINPPSHLRGVDSVRTGSKTPAASVSVNMVGICSTLGSQDDENYNMLPQGTGDPFTEFLEKFPKPIQERLGMHCDVQHFAKKANQPIDPVCNVYLASPHNPINHPDQLVDKYGLTDFSEADPHTRFIGLWNKDPTPFDVKGKLMHIFDINGKDHPIPMVPDVRFSHDTVCLSMPVYDPHTSNYYFRNWATPLPPPEARVNLPDIEGEYGEAMVSLMEGHTDGNSQPIYNVPLLTGRNLEHIAVRYMMVQASQDMKAPWIISHFPTAIPYLPYTREERDNILGDNLLYKKTWADLWEKQFAPSPFRKDWTSAQTEAVQQANPYRGSLSPFSLSRSPSSASFDEFTVAAVEEENPQHTPRSPNVHVDMFTAMGPMIGQDHMEGEAGPAVLVHRAPAGGNRRPRQAEPYLSQDRQGTNLPAIRPPHPYGGTAEDRMAAAMVTLTLAQLVQLSSNPHFMQLMESFKVFMQTDTSQAEPAIHVVQDAFNKVAETYTGPSASSVQTVPVTPPTQLSEPDQPTLQDSLPKPDAPSLHSPSVTYPVADNTSEGTYLNAATLKPQVLYQATASMPVIQAGFYNPDTTVQFLDTTMCLDTGCNVCIMSDKALARDWDSLTRFGKVYNLKAFNVQLADESVSTTQKGIQGVQLVIGSARYEVDFLVAPALAHDYILGFGFQAIYNLQIKPHLGKVTLGAERENWLGSGTYRDYQSIPLSYACKKIPFLLANHTQE